MNWPFAFFVFVTSLVADITWARWVITTTSLQTWQATGWAVCIILLGAVSIDAIAQSVWYAVPSALGAGTGTYLTVWHAKR